MQNIYLSNEVPLLIMLGQSNTDGRGIKQDVSDMAAYSFADQVKIFHKPIKRNPSSASINHVNDGFWQNYTGSNGMIVSPQTGSVATSCGPELATAYLWATSVYPVINKSLYIIKCAIGGTPLANNTKGVDTNWSPAAGQIWELASLYTIRPAITQLLCAGKIPKLIGVFWGQGESDATATAAAQYQANLTQLIANIRTKLGFSAAKVVVMGLSNYNNPPAPWQQVKDAQITVTNNDNNTALIKTDGSDNLTPDNRYLANVEATDLHYTAIGNASIAEKAFLQYRFSGDNYDQSVNDFELIANASLGYTSTNLAKLPITLANNGGIFQKLTASSSAGIVPTYSWIADPTTLLRKGTGDIPSPRFRLNTFDGAQDQEMIFRMAHDGDVSTKPGVLLRGSHASSNVANADFLTGILVQVRNGGKQLTVFLRQNSQWVTQQKSPITTPSSIANNQLVWYRVKIVAKTLTIDIFNQDNLVKEATPPLDADWINVYGVSNDDFPAVGQTWFTLYNGLMSKNGPYAAHFHMPILIANKLTKA